MMTILSQNMNHDSYILRLSYAHPHIIENTYRIAINLIFFPSDKIFHLLLLDSLHNIPTLKTKILLSIHKK